MNDLQRNKKWREDMKALGWCYVSFMVPTECKKPLLEYRKKQIQKWLRQQMREQFKKGRN